MGRKITKEELIAFAWSNGRCQCRNPRCWHHAGVCGVELRWGWRVALRNPVRGAKAHNLMAICGACSRVADRDG
jgi:hypothetical protein